MCLLLIFLDRSKRKVGSLEILTSYPASFLSLVNRTRPELPPGMSSRGDAIVISDDDDDLMIVDERSRQRTIEKAEAGPSTRPRHDHSMSPSIYRVSKRQRLEGNPPSSNLEAVIKPEFPKLQLNFETDENGNTQLYPHFFEDAFIQNATPNNEEVQIVMEVPRQIVEVPPYFEDPKLQIRMYRGPGFENFPIPFDASHQEFCDKWDARKRSREQRRIREQTFYNDFGPYVDTTAPVKDSDDEAESGPKLTVAQTECLVKIIDILPDVKRDFVVEKIKSSQESYTFHDEEIEILPEVDTIISELLEMDSYPKEPKVEQRVVPYEKETGKTIVWTKDHQQNRDYLRDAVIVLASQFDYVPTHYIHKIVHDKNSLWDAFVHIDDIDRNYFQSRDRPYSRSRRPRTSLEKKYQRHSPYRDPEYYASVVLELQAAKQHQMRENLKRNEEQQKAVAEIENLDHHKAAGLIVTCGCCFDDEIPMNRAVNCTAETEEHSFCFNCVEGLANTQIGMMRHEMACMDGSGCKERLDMDGVGRAVPYKTYNKLLLNEQQAEIAAANLEGLEQCPFCDFKAICDPIEVDTIFSCQNPDCFKVTCRKCLETSHLPRSCEDVKNDRGLSARHKVEEARSAAMMRPCPKCKTNLIKEEGCNKMRCRCGAFFCYVCKTDLSKLRDPYGHFDRNSTSGGKCTLYDTPGVDRHVKEANDAEVEAIKAAKEADDSIEEKLLQIETGKVAVTATATHGRVRNPAGRYPNVVPPNDYDRERDALRMANEGLAARARRRAMVAAPRINIPHLPAAPPAYPGWPGHLAPRILVQPDNVNVDAWRNGVMNNNAQLPAWQANDNAGILREPVAEPDEWRGFDDLELMDLDFNNNLPAIQAQRNLNQVDEMAVAQRVNDFRNELHRRRTHRQRRHSDRDNAQPQPIMRPAQSEYQLPPMFSQQAVANGQVQAFQQNLQQNAFDQGYALGGLAEQLNANQWRAQFRPATPVPIPQRPRARDQEAQAFPPFNRGLPHRRETVPPTTGLLAYPNAQGEQNNQGQAQVQHRPQDNNHYGWV